MLERKEILSGFGHPLYRAYDPRAVILKRISEDFSHDGGEPDWYAITEAAERNVFEEKGLYPNVDLYSGSVYRYLGIRPTCSRRSSPRVALPGGRPRARAARRQQDHSPVCRVRGRAAPLLSGARPRGCKGARARMIVRLGYVPQAT